MRQALPIEYVFDLGRLSKAEQIVTLAPDAQERARIAAWAGVETLDALTAEIALHKQSPSQFLAQFKLRAEVGQNCVATLEPMTSSIARDFTRLLHFAAAPYRDAPPLAAAVLDLSEEDGLEEIENLRYDLAAPVLEELVLAIDPYPRKAGFQLPGEAPPSAKDRQESPFAVLKSLKSRS